MHELGITRNIVAIVGDAANDQRVGRVTLEVGKLAGVMIDAIAFCFDVVAEGTSLEGATLHIVEVDGRARCNGCGGEFTMATLYTACPCGSRDIERLAGEELNIKSFEYREMA